MKLEQRLETGNYNNKDMKVWIGLILLRIRKSDGLL
jgi:hypothetical protein